MKHIITAIFITLTALSVTAQSSSGLFEAETDVNFVYSGTGWIQIVDGDYSVMESSAIDDSVSFEFNGSSVIVYRELLLLGSASAEICLDTSCTTITSTSATADQIRVPVAFVASGASPHTLTITNTDGGLFRLDSVLVMPDDVLQTTYPAPSVQYLTLESGRVVAVDFSITGGDIATIIFLAFLSSVTLYGIMIARTNHE